jgi:hypothetical protein
MYNITRIYNLVELFLAVDDWAGPDTSSVLHNIHRVDDGRSSPTLTLTRTLALALAVAVALILTLTLTLILNLAIFVSISSWNRHVCWVHIGGISIGTTLTALGPLFPP